MTAVVQFNPFAPEFYQDPYSVYKRLREQAPALWVEKLGGWVISRYPDVKNAQQDSKMYSNAFFNDVAFGEYYPVPKEEALNINSCDPPDHTRIRRLVARAFTPGVINALEPKIKDVIDLLLDGLEGRHEIRFMEDLAEPFPVSVVAAMLGLDVSRRREFITWTEAVVSASSRAAMSPEQLAEVRRCSDAMRDYIGAAIADRRKSPTDDLLSVMVKAEEDDVLSSGEVLSAAVLLFLGGGETTTNLLGNALVQLIKDPALERRIREDRSLINGFIEEALRFNAPAQIGFKQAMVDIPIGDVIIKSGQIVMPLIGSANRDEQAFPNADDFDITRNNAGHLAFGHGIHFCIGAGLSRLEARVFFNELFDRYPTIESLNAPVWRDSFWTRRPVELELKV